MPLTDILMEERQLWKSIQNQCDIAFDVGIYDICHLCHFREPENNTKIYLFEPNKDCIKNITKMYGSMNNVYIYDNGFGNITEDIEIYHNTNSAMYSKKIRHNPFNKKASSFTAKIVTLDDFCHSNNILKIDFLKIDIEGYDGRALLGGKEIIKTCKWIQIENFFCLEPDINIKNELVQIVKDMNLHIYRMICGKFTKVEVDNWLQDVLIVHKQFNSPFCNYLLSKEEFVI